MTENVYLSVCALYRNDADYLEEWLEFHRLVGVGRFILYNNFSEDDHRKVLAPYIEEQIVTLVEWPRPFFPIKDGMMEALRHCLREYGRHCRWMAFLDIDEFLFSPTGIALPELLVEYENYPGIGVNWAMFGTSGHVTKPPGLVIENYMRRTDNPQHNRRIKSIVQPAQVARCSLGPHYFFYKDGPAVDENKNPIVADFTDSVSFSRLRINHYWSKSEEEVRRKLDRWEDAGGNAWTPRPWNFFEQRDARFNEHPDDTILMYLPALKEALANRAQAREPGVAPGRDG
jgi:hypothetical protein